MSDPDIQYFAESGVWHKPANAVRVDGLFMGGGGGGGGGALGRDGETAELRCWSRPADEIGDTIQIEIGKGGRGFGGGGDGADGYALIVTHMKRA